MSKIAQSRALVEVTVPVITPGDGELECFGVEIDEERLLAHGESLLEQYRQAAAVVGRLRAAGWKVTEDGCDVRCTHPDVHSAAEAERRMAALDVDEFYVIK